MTLLPFSLSFFFLSLVLLPFSLFFDFNPRAVPSYEGRYVPVPFPQLRDTRMQSGFLTHHSLVIYAFSATYHELSPYNVSSHVLGSITDTKLLYDHIYEETLDDHYAQSALWLQCHYLG